VSGSDDGKADYLREQAAAQLAPGCATRLDPRGRAVSGTGFGVGTRPGHPGALVLYRCSTCSRLFADEQALRAHQDHYQALHAIDPRVDEHDGEPWSTAAFHDGDTVGSGDTWAVFRGWADDEIWADHGYPVQRVRMSPAEFAARAVGLRDADQQAAFCFVARAKAGGLGDDHDETCAAAYLAKQWRRCQRLDPERCTLVAHQLHVLIALALGGAE